MIAMVENGAGPAVEPAPLEKLKTTVSASRLNCWLQCRLKFYFRYVLKIAKPKTAALHFGSVVHLVLQQWSLGRWRKQPFEIAKLKEVFEAGWIEQGQIDWDGEEPEQKNTAWLVLEKYFIDTLPQEIFLNAARTNWGVAWLDPDLDLVVRHHWPFPSPGPYPSLPWTAAKILGAVLNETPSEKWIRYYDFNKTWVSLSYHLALVQNPGYFHGKIVFIGSKPRTPLADGEVDEFRVPQTRWTGEAVGGVEILVTSFLNLLNGDWLRRLAWPVEGMLFIFFGTAFGIFLCLFQRRRTVLLAFIAFVALMYGGIYLSEFSNYWFPWLIVVGGQLPCALAWALAVPRKSASEKTVVMDQKTIVLTFPDDESPDAPDFELFNPPVGQGAYGKVWIVRNAIGQWQALKAIYQSKFGDNTRPYEAEFNGLQKYKPVSEKHSGLLRIEMVSKMKNEDYFYYVMELGDAQVDGWEKNPPTYKPRDLDNMRKQAPGRRLPTGECLRIITILADALDFLHRQGLIHRDIKPSNVIFVNNRPKLADIGLVADIRPADYNNTLVGTPGYMPPMPNAQEPSKQIFTPWAWCCMSSARAKIPHFFRRFPRP